MYYIFLDESGTFSRDNDNSVVGGLITTASVYKINEIFNELCDNINDDNNTDFTLNDIHIAPLLYPDTTGTDAEKARFRNIDISKRKAFAEACKEKVVEFSEKCVISRNKGLLIGIDNQSRYGVNLLSAVQKALDYLKEKNNKKDVVVAIAPRSPKNFSRDITYRDYHTNLCQYVRKSFGHDYEFGISVKWRQDNYSGFSAADVVCSFKDGLPQGNVLETTVDDEMLKKYNNTIKYFVNKLINNNEIAAAYRIADEKKLKHKILKSLSSIEDTNLLLGEIHQLINFAYALIDKRAVNHEGIDDAYEICKVITNVAEKELEAVEDTSLKSKWLIILVNVTNGLMAFYNHKGNTEAGETYRDVLTKLMESHSDILGRNYNDIVLDTRNRSYNSQFNNYKFDEIINDFENAVKERREDIPSGKDPLTGKMLGTIGQAYAFSASMQEKDTQEEYRRKAQKYIEDSFPYFHNDSNDKDFCRGVGYLVTLHCEERKYNKALKSFTLLNQYDIPDTNHLSTGADRAIVIDSWVQIIIDDKTPNSAAIFDLVTIIKIYIEGCERNTINWDTISDIVKFVEQHENENHPYELLYKWLGIAYIKNEEYGKAINILNHSMKVVKQNDFTVETIALSSLGLKITAEKLSGNQNAESNFRSLVKRVEDLCTRSVGFHEYVFAIGGVEKMKKDLTENNIDAIARWLPYGYA